MHSLTKCFLQDEPPETISEKQYFPFSLIFSGSKQKKYYAPSKSEHQRWTMRIKKVLNYAALSEFYEMGENIGKGKFGQVKYAVHKKTKKKVAVKVMQKNMMSSSDLELVRQEIEMLKICQHPNLIRMLDVFENPEFIYIVMELLEGGDLFSYLENLEFKIPERRAIKIIHSLAAGLYYLHSYGIVHRDIKPENILMVDKTDNSDVKIVDFGLSKMVGPTQLCSEPFGTLAYVAPEVLMKKPYGKGVDIWSLGVISHLLLVGMLPFDSDDEKEIVK